jgi:hypothetical protein
MRCQPFLPGFAALLCAVHGCRQPEAPGVEAEVYSLIAVDGAALPTRGIAAASLAMSPDHLFILTQRDTAGVTSVAIGTVHWVGPFETDRAHLRLVPDSDSAWQATSFNVGDSLTLTRAEQRESYRRR